MKKAFNLYAVLLIGIFLIPAIFISCSENVSETENSDGDLDQNDTIYEQEQAERPDGWDEASHSKDIDPDYAIVFPYGQVKRLDIVISPENWQAMRSDLAEIIGEFGEAPNNANPPAAPPGDPPPEAYAACTGKQQGDACEMDINSMHLEGFCMVFTDGKLVCNPDATGPDGDFDADFDGIDGDAEKPNDPPPEAFEACLNKQEGDSCVVNINGITLTGSCMKYTDNRLLCGIGDGPSPDDPMVQAIMKLHERKPIYKPCRVMFDGKTWNSTGIRYKGNSSLVSTWWEGLGKLSLRLDFDKFEDDYPEIKNQRFYGFDELSLSNNAHDNSLLRQKVVADIFRDAGVPSPRTAFYRVFVDFGEGSTYFGLYTMTEIPEYPMLDSQFGDDNGNLYKPSGVGATWEVFEQDSFVKKSNKSEEDWSDVEAMFEALHADRRDAATWRSNLENVFDVDGFLLWLAVNTIIVNWDSYGLMFQNYYIYNDPTDNKFSWIPWDFNEALKNSAQALSLEMTEVGNKWPLIRFLLDDPKYYTLYKNNIQKTLESVFVADQLQAKIQAEHDLIKAYVIGEDGEIDGYSLLKNQDGFEAELESILEHITLRQTEASEFLGR